MILNGWKEIARHLGRGVRTIQRWEQVGLPVRRPNAHIRSAVIAISEELDEWVKSLPQRELVTCAPPRERKRIDPAQLAIRVQVLTESLAQLRSLRREQHRLVQQAMERRLFIQSRRKTGVEHALSKSENMR